MIHVYLRRVYVLLFGDEMSCKYKSSLFDLECDLILLYPCRYFVWRIYVLLTVGCENPYNDCIAINLFLKVFQDFLYIFRCFYVGYIYIYNGYILLLDYSLEYYVVTFFVSYMTFILKSTLPDDISITTTRVFFFFSCPFAWNIFSIPSLSACVNVLFRGVFLADIYVDHVS